MRPLAPVRRALAAVLGVAGLVVYNWWVAVVLGWIGKPGGGRLLASTDSLFSDLEATGRPEAALLSHLDVVGGLLLVGALLLRGSAGPDGPRREWRWLLCFGLAAAVGGLFPYVCAEGVDAACRSAEWHLHLPPRHYVHVVSGIIEFLAASGAVLLAWRRTSGQPGWVGRAVRVIGVALVVGYPLLGLTYLSDRLGALVEPVFFVAFSAIVAVELAEPAEPTELPAGTEVRAGRTEP
jgi:Protein of unknown function (DUF998)